MKLDNQGRDTITNGMPAFIIDPARVGDSDWIRKEDCDDGDLPYCPRGCGNLAEPVLIPGDPTHEGRGAAAAAYFCRCWYLC